MTYALIEFAKENQGTIAAHQKERVIEEKEKIEIAKKKPKEKKEQLTKRQKARQGNRLVDGELPRGYDWVCLIRHLSQTGSAADWIFFHSTNFDSVGFSECRTKNIDQVFLSERKKGFSSR